MSFEYTTRIYDVLCALSEGVGTAPFERRVVDAAHTMISERGSIASAILYCSCLMD